MAHQDLLLAEVPVQTAGGQARRLDPKEIRLRWKYSIASGDEFVGDALAGNDAVEQARQFHATVGIDAVILTKLDVDAKGGAALSIASAIVRPIAFVGIGQDYDDLMPFDAAWIVERIFAA